jgi:hypothetical protein
VSVLSQQVSTISQLLSTLRGGVTGQVLKKSANADYAWTWAADATGGSGSAGVTSNTLSIHSQAISVLSQQVSVLSQQVSVLSQGLSVVSNAPATRCPSPTRPRMRRHRLERALERDLEPHVGRQRVSNAASNALSVANAASNAASIVSQALSVETAARIAKDDTLSQQVSVLSQQVSTLSQAVSVMSQLLSTLRGGTTGQVLKKSANADYAWVVGGRCDRWRCVGWDYVEYALDPQPGD